MATIPDTSTPQNLWAGWNNEQYYGDDKYNQTKPFVQVPPYASGGIRNNQLTKGAWEKWLSQFTPNAQPLPATQNTPTTQVATNEFGFADFVSENKFLILGALAIGGFLLMRGGGAPLAERSVVTRYGKAR